MSCLVLIVFSYLYSHLNVFVYYYCLVETGINCYTVVYISNHYYASLTNSVPALETKKKTLKLKFRDTHFLNLIFLYAIYLIELFRRLTKFMIFKKFIWIKFNHNSNNSTKNIFFLKKLLSCNIIDCKNWKAYQVLIFHVWGCENSLTELNRVVNRFWKRSSNDRFSIRFENDPLVLNF